MAYLVLSGNIPQNKTGVGCRGYHVFRVGKRVRVVWGPIEFVRKKMRFEWTRRTCHVDYRSGSVAAALRRLRQLIAFQVQSGYQRLGAGSRIYRTSKAIGSTLWRRRA